MSFAEHADEEGRAKFPSPPGTVLARTAVEIDRNADFHAWAHARTVLDAVEREQAVAGDAEARSLLDRLAARSGLDPQTVRRRVRTVRWVASHDLVRVLEEQALPIGVVCKIALHKGLSDAVKVALIEELCAATLARPEMEIRTEMERRLREFAPRANDTHDWQRGGDDWDFSAHDADLGRRAQPFRLAGQAALNLIARFRLEGGSVVSACCGSGTVLDACAMLGVEDYVGFDLRLDARVAERHAGHFLKFDATSLDWARICAPGAAGLIVITPPPFCFGKSAETAAPTDLGRFSDPAEWLAGMERVIAGATAALAVGGVIAVAVRQTAEFEDGTPVPDLRTEVGRLLAEAGFEMFLGNPIVTVGRGRAAHRVGAWLVPEVVQIVVMRKS